MKFDLLYRRRWWLLYVPILLMAAALLWLSYTRWMPQPPRSITIAAASFGDSSAQLALQYRQGLAEMGIGVEVVSHPSAKLALDAVMSEPARADATFVSGMHASSPSVASGQVQTLAVIEREPIWIFSRIPQMTKLQELRGMRIGIAEQDELALGLATRLLEHVQLKANDVQLMKVPSNRISNALIDGQIDIAIVLASASDESVRVMMRSPYIQILGVDQIRKLTSQEPRLRPFVLPQGVIELRGDIPARDLTLLSADLQLVIRPQLHPALQRALLDVATQLHERPSFLQRQGEFPRATDADFPVSATALAAMRGNKPWLEHVLPFGWAQWVQWLVLAFLPIVLATIALLAWIPSWFDWRINAVLQNFYGELKFLESEIDPVASERPIEMTRLLQRLDEIEMQVMQLELPAPYSERWYTLRSHLAGARDHLLGLRAR
jgi:TRAP-type uncharacterized transport system substrate-binding protein